MKIQRVLVSSVMKDFGSRREAARQALEEMGIEAVLAENLGAQAGAPRTVILEEIIPACDAVIGIYGSRYGWTGARGGLSPSEEEYDKARELFKPVYAFIDRLDTRPPEPRQQQFLEKVQNWDQGLTRNEFFSLKELKQKIKAALRGRDLSPRYRKFLENLRQEAGSMTGSMKFRETSQAWQPAFDLVLHAPGSQFTAGVESLLAVVDGDCYDRNQISQAVAGWREALQQLFQTGFLKAKNVTATVIIVVQKNPFALVPDMLEENKAFFGACNTVEVLVDLAGGTVSRKPRSWWTKPWYDPLAKMLEGALGNKM
ncbi:MAG: DUF4062 domain-containing protein [Desulfobacteraceae bacterium]